MLVREDDTFVCESCYADEPSIDHDLWPARARHATVQHGVCDSCGRTEPDEGSTT